jgi:hypothetical protein
MGMIDRNLESIILYGAFDGNRPARRAVKDKEYDIRTLVPMCMIDARESGGQSILGFLFAMWAVRRAGTGRSVM